MTFIHPFPMPSKRLESPPKSRRRESPSKSSRTTKGEDQRPPVSFISIEIEDDQRDDVGVNELVGMIQRRDWMSVAARVQTMEGINEASRPLSNGNYALHVICKCGQDHRVSKYRGFQGATEQKYSDASSKLTGTISSRGSSIMTGSTPTENSNLSGSFTPSVSYTPSIDSCTPSASITTKEISDFQQGREPLPSRAVLEAVMKANPAALKKQGADEATPLHWAVRYRYPLELLNVLIKDFPQALDIRDAGTRTPRSYASLLDHPPSRSALLRPTSCWLQHNVDERKYTAIATEVDLLEEELSTLYKALTIAQEEEAALQQRVVTIENELHSFGSFQSNVELAEAAAKIQDELEGTLDVLRGTLDGLVGQIMTKYSDGEKDRAYLASFNADVERVYNNINASIDELSKELENIAHIMAEK